MAWNLRKYAALALVLVLVCSLYISVEALRHKKRNDNLSIFNPFLVLDEEDVKELGKAGARYAQAHQITRRNPILLVPGVSKSLPFAFRFGNFLLVRFLTLTEC